MIDKGGRPQKNIDKKMFEKLCAIQCTKDEICGIFEIDEKTLTRWCKDTYNEGFSDTFKKKSQSGKASLRRTQFKLAEKNPTMAIWLGKQYLGQRDNIEVEHKDLSKVEELLSKIDKEANNDNK